MQLLQRQSILKILALAKVLFRLHVLFNKFRANLLLAEIRSKDKKLYCAFIWLLDLDVRYSLLTISFFIRTFFALSPNQIFCCFHKRFVNFFYQKRRCWISIDWLIFEGEQLWLVLWKQTSSNIGKSFQPYNTLKWLFRK